MSVKTISKKNASAYRLVGVFNKYGFARVSKAYDDRPNEPDEYTPIVYTSLSKWDFLLAPNELSEWSK
jgi:hypothetical protein